ncbi:MAG: recombinase family protein [Clostridia bacterium]|nr:recombinase family protein [Clostridia bacterium]
MIYGYARVSTKGQQREGNSLTDQEKRLKEAGAEIIVSDSFTGTRMDRPQFSTLIERLQPGDTLIVTKLDRFARTATDGAQSVRELVSRGVTVNILNMGIADNTPMGKLMVTVLLAFSEYERDMIVERTQTGKSIAREKEGFTEGRPPRYTTAQINHALSLLKDHSYEQVVALTGISKSTLIRARRKENPSAPPHSKS